MSMNKKPKAFGCAKHDVHVVDGPSVCPFCEEEVAGASAESIAAAIETDRKRAAEFMRAKAYRFHEASGHADNDTQELIAGAMARALESMAHRIEYGQHAPAVEPSEPVAGTCIHCGAHPDAHRVNAVLAMGRATARSLATDPRPVPASRPTPNQEPER